MTDSGYTPGWSAGASAFMRRRSAATHGGPVMGHLRPGMALLDLGCGPGSITVGLARAVAPGRVTAVDREESQIRLLAERIEASPALDRSVELGWATAAGVRGMARALREWSALPGGMFAQAWVTATGRAAPR